MTKKQFKVYRLGDLEITYDYIPGTLGYNDPENPCNNIGVVPDELHITSIELIDGGNRVKLLPVSEEYANSSPQYPTWLTEALYNIHTNNPAPWRGSEITN